VLFAPAGVHLNARNRLGIGNFHKVDAIFRPLANRLIVENRAASAFTQAWRIQTRLMLGAPSFPGLREYQSKKRLLQVDVLSSFANRPLSPVTSDLAVTVNA
jgi:hypothetical protein